MSRMAPSMRVNGVDLYAMVRVSKSGLMACVMTATGLTVSTMAMVV